VITTATNVARFDSHKQLARKHLIGLIVRLSNYGATMQGMERYELCEMNYAIWIIQDGICEMNWS